MKHGRLFLLLSFDFAKLKITRKALAFQVSLTSRREAGSGPRWYRQSHCSVWWPNEQSILVNHDISPTYQSCSVQCGFSTLQPHIISPSCLTRHVFASCHTHREHQPASQLAAVAGGRGWGSWSGGFHHGKGEIGSWPTIWWPQHTVVLAKRVVFSSLSI